jgi:hypothetical protein
MKPFTQSSLAAQPASGAGVLQAPASGAPTQASAPGQSARCSQGAPPVDPVVPEVPVLPEVPASATRGRHAPSAAQKSELAQASGCVPRQLPQCALMQWLPEAHSESALQPPPTVPVLPELPPST